MKAINVSEDSWTHIASNTVILQEDIMFSALTSTLGMKHDKSQQWTCLSLRVWLNPKITRHRRVQFFSRFPPYVNVISLKTEVCTVRMYVSRPEEALFICISHRILNGWRTSIVWKRNIPEQRHIIPNWRFRWVCTTIQYDWWAWSMICLKSVFVL